MKRRDFVKSTLIAGAGLVAGSGLMGCRNIAGVSGSNQRAKPNVLFLFTDDQRFDTISALGNRSIRTPNIDRLVHTGTSFTNAYIMGGSSPAVCSPSRAALFSGRTLWNLENQGMWGFEISDKYRTGMLLSEQVRTSREEPGILLVPLVPEIRFFFGE